MFESIPKFPNDIYEFTIRNGTVIWMLALESISVGDEEASVASFAGACLALKSDPLMR